MKKNVSFRGITVPNENSRYLEYVRLPFSYVGTGNSIGFLVSSSKILICNSEISFLSSFLLPFIEVTGKLLGGDRAENRTW